jgi:type IV pilus assembly protein PilV
MSVTNWKIGFKPAKEGGFTLIEVLISMLVLMVGLMGVAGMQLISFQNNQNAYLRSQATYIASDMLDRIRANPGGHRNGATAYRDIQVPSTVPAAQTCITSTAGCAPDALANQDAREWAAHFDSAYGAASQQPTLPGGRGVVSYDVTTNEYIVTVFWDEKDWVENTSGDVVRGDNVERSVQLRTVIQ